jgi:hypothetical protein
MKRKADDKGASSVAKRSKTVIVTPRRFAITQKGKKWLIIDNTTLKALTTFTPFPSTWKEIQATEIYKAIIPTRQIESMMWRQTAEESKDVQSLAGMLNLAGSSMKNMIDAVAYGGETKEAKAYHQGAMSLFEADNESWGKYGFEATNRLKDIANWMVWKGKVPNTLLAGISGCQDVAWSGSIQALHQEPSVRLGEVIAYPPDIANRLRSQLAEQALLLGNQKTALHWLARRDQAISDEERATFADMRSFATA